MHMKATAASALLLSAVASDALAEGTKMSVPLAVPSDPRARYTLMEFEQVADRVILVTTMREGPSGASYSARVIDCGRMRFKYVAEGETLAEVTANRETNRARVSTDGLGPLVRGSISDYLTRQACAVSVSW